MGVVYLVRLIAMYCLVVRFAQSFLACSGIAGSDLVGLPLGIPLDTLGTIYLPSGKLSPAFTLGLMSERDRVQAL